MKKDSFSRLLLGLTGAETFCLKYLQFWLISSSLTEFDPMDFLFMSPSDTLARNQDRTTRTGPSVWDGDLSHGGMIHQTYLLRLFPTFGGLAQTV